MPALIHQRTKVYTYSRYYTLRFHHIEAFYLQATGRIPDMFCVFVDKLGAFSFQTRKADIN